MPDSVRTARLRRIFSSSNRRLIAPASSPFLYSFKISEFNKMPILCFFASFLFLAIKSARELTFLPSNSLIAFNLLSFSLAVDMELLTYYT